MTENKEITVAEFNSLLDYIEVLETSFESRFTSNMRNMRDGWVNTVYLGNKLDKLIPILQKYKSNYNFNETIKSYSENKIKTLEEFHDLENSQTKSIGNIHPFNIILTEGMKITVKDFNALVEYIDKLKILYDTIFKTHISYIEAACSDTEYAYQAIPQILIYLVRDMSIKKWDKDEIAELNRQGKTTEAYRKNYDEKIKEDNEKAERIKKERSIPEKPLNITVQDFNALVDYVNKLKKIYDARFLDHLSNKILYIYTFGNNAAHNVNALFAHLLNEKSFLEASTRSNIRKLYNTMYEKRTWISKYESYIADDTAKKIKAFRPYTEEKNWSNTLMERSRLEQVRAVEEAKAAGVARDAKAKAEYEELLKRKKDESDEQDAIMRNRRALAEQDTAIRGPAIIGPAITDTVTTELVTTEQDSLDPVTPEPVTIEPVTTELDSLDPATVATSGGIWTKRRRGRKGRRKSTKRRSTKRRSSKRRSSKRKNTKRRR